MSMLSTDLAAAHAAYRPSHSTLRKIINRTALVVEDEPHCAELLSTLLKELGFTSLIAYDGTTALHIAHYETFGIAFVDLGLPDISGLEVIDQLKHLHPATHIVIATGYVREVARDKRESSFPFTVLPKPYSMEEVKKTLASIGSTWEVA